MIICVCKAVSDRQIKAAVDSGANSLREITQELQVGTCCGKCLPEAKAVLLARLAHRSETPGAEISLTQRIESAANTLFGGTTKGFAA